MSAWLACRRATLLIPSGPSHDPDRLHLHILLNDPPDDGRVLVVSVTSIPSTQIYDPSCTLFPNEHPFVTKGSYIAYRFCSFADAKHLEQQVRSGAFVAKQILDEKIFNLVVEGLFDSPHAAPKYKKFMHERTDE